MSYTLEEVHVFDLSIYPDPPPLKEKKREKKEIDIQQSGLVSLL